MMSVADVLDALDAIGVPATTLIWEAAPPLPYVVLKPGQSRDFRSDGWANRHKMREYVIELYTRRRDVALEQRVEAVFDAARWPYSTDVTAGGEDEDSGKVCLFLLYTTLTEPRADG